MLGVLFKELIVQFGTLIRFLAESKMRKLILLSCVQVVSMFSANSQVSLFTRVFL